MRKQEQQNDCIVYKTNDNLSLCMSKTHFCFAQIIMSVFLFKKSGKIIHAIGILTQIKFNNYANTILPQIIRCFIAGSSQTNLTLWLLILRNFFISNFLNI